MRRPCAHITHINTSMYTLHKVFPHSSVSKESACYAGDLGLIPGSGRSPGEGNNNPLQYSCLENPVDRGAWWATVHGVIRVRHDLATEERDTLHKSVMNNNLTPRLHTVACHHMHL